MDATELLMDSVAGSRPAADALMPLVYDELRGLARYQLSRERCDHTLQTTALVNEAYLKLIDQRRVDPSSRTRFFALAGMAFRRILWDHAKARNAHKRVGGRERVLLHDDLIQAENMELEALDLLEAVDRLNALHERQARVVELRFFSGLTDGQIAAELSVSRRTVVLDWRTARAWLRRELSRGDDSSG